MAWRDDLKEAFTHLKSDTGSIGRKAYDVARNDNDRDLEMSRRHLLQLGGSAMAVGAASQIPGAADDYSLRSPVTRKDSNEPTENPFEDTAPEEGDGSDEPTSSEDDLAYSSISDGLEEQGDGAVRAFRGYTVTALDEQIDDSYEEFMGNTGEYESEIREALEGTEFEDGRFRVGEYGVSDGNDGAWLDFNDEDREFSDEFSEYMADLDADEELEDEVFGYVQDLGMDEL